MGADTLVGRDRELAALHGLAEAAMSGAPVVALVAGEAGIGKSTLLSTFAAQSGLRLVTGSASQSDGAPAFWPWRRVLDVLAAETSDARRSHPWDGELDEMGTGGSASSQDRFAAFTAVADAVDAATADRPTLVVLDDLHWADAGSLTLLTHLARELRSGRVLIVGSLRPAELNARREGRELVSAVARHHPGAHLDLDGLGFDDISRQLEALLGTAPAPDVVGGVLRRTGGNPLFVRELGLLMRTGDASAVPAPTAVRDAVGEHLAALSMPCRELVAAAAVVGMEVDPALLAAVAELDVANVLEMLDEARRSGVLGEPSTAGRYRFAHDLFRECVALDMPVSRVATLHLRIAEQLGSARGIRRANEIAHHRLAALPMGDHTAAASAAREAAALALHRLAFEDAAAVLDRALAADVPAPTRITILLDAARAHYLAQDVAAAMRLCAEVVEIATGIGDVAAIADAALVAPEVTDPAWSPQVREWCSQALRLLPPAETPLRARLLARRTIAGAFSSDAASMAHDSEQALAMAERVADDAALITALRARQLARSTPDGNSERIVLGRRMIELGSRNNDRDAVFWGRVWRFEALVQSGRLDGTKEDLVALDTLLEQLRQPLHRWHLQRAQCVVRAARGRFAAARRMALDSLDAPSGEPTMADTMTVMGPLLEIAMLTGDTGFDPWPYLPKPDARSGGTQPYGHRLAEWHLAFGRIADAEELYDRLPAAASPAAPFIALVVTASAGAVAAELGDVDGARRAYRELLPHKHLHVASGAGVSITRGSVHHFLGRTAAATGDVPQAIDHFAAACTANDAAGLTPYACGSRLHLAELLAVRNRAGDRDRAATVLAECTAEARRLGMRPVTTAAADLAGRLDDAGELGRLSARQLEVAELVASGLTNRQIADKLHVSVRTAENHVRNIMTTLGFRTRSQIATWVTEHGQSV
ncbi:ATP-binding protein [Pseudonocardia sp. TRM90224]|uniref:ATP-binding protein n=1 Tax=Pseudonocardia sp. TRM90224 TaxID=2812678 RepID=UPI001E572A03|nr:LuxR family transcriptional regulator [Pseudonocardia sp. TRM90224]